MNNFFGSFGARNKFRWLYLVQTATPSNPPSGVDLLYFKSDNKLYSLTSAGVETEIGSSSLASPLTTKGDVWGYTTTNARIPVGTNGQYLTADSTQALGVKWTTAGSGTGNILDINADATPNQLLTVGTTGTDFAIVDDGIGGHSFNLPSASATARGVVTTGAQTLGGAKTLSSAPILSALTASKAVLTDGSKVVVSSTYGESDWVLTSTNQTVAGVKTLSSAPIVSALTASKPVFSDGSKALTSTGTVPLNQGGTGQTTQAAAFDALSPMTTSGDIIYGGASGTGTRLGKGSDGQVLTLASGVPSWATGGGGGSIGGSTGATDNRVIRADGTGGATIQSSAVTMDDSGNISGVGTFTLSGVQTSTANVTSGSIPLYLNCPSSGSGTAYSFGMDLKVAAGGTNDAIYGLLVEHYAAPAGSSPSFASGAGGMAMGINSSCNANLSTGCCIGLFGVNAGASKYQVGTAGINFQVSDNANYRSAGVFGYCVVSATPTNAKAQGGCFALGTGNPVVTTIANVNAALVGDNGNTTAFPLWAGDNGTACFSVADGGICTLGAASATPKHVLNTDTYTAASDALTLLNGPAGKAGNPAIYIKITVNGTDYAIPAW